MQRAKQSQNFLFVGSTEDSHRCLFRIALKFAEQNHPVLFIAARPFESLPMNSVTALNEQTLRNIIFRYANSCSALLKTLLDIHLWTLKPRLVLLDGVQSFFAEPTDKENWPAATPSPSPTKFIEFFENHCLVTACLHNAIDSMSMANGTTCYTIMSVDFACNEFRHFYAKMQQTLLDLYFYGREQIVSETNFDAVERKIVPLKSRN